MNEEQKKLTPEEIMEFEKMNENLKKASKELKETLNEAINIAHNFIEEQKISKND